MNDPMQTFHDAMNWLGAAMPSEPPDDMDLLPEDATEGAPVGWKIVALGSDGSVLCEHTTGRRVRYWFTGTARA